MVPPAHARCAQVGAWVKGQPWHCCSPGSTCTLTARQQEQLYDEPGQRAASARCVRAGTVRLTSPAAHQHHRIFRPQVLRPGNHSLRPQLLLLQRVRDVRGPRRRLQGVRAQEGHSASLRPQQAALPPRQMHRWGHLLLRRGPALRFLYLLRPRRRPVLSKGQPRSRIVLPARPGSRVFSLAQRVHLLRPGHRGVRQELLRGGPQVRLAGGEALTRASGSQAPRCVCVRLASTERATARVTQERSAGRQIRHQPRPLRHPTASRERRNNKAAAHPRPEQKGRKGRGKGVSEE